MKTRALLLAALLLPFAAYAAKPQQQAPAPAPAPAPKINGYRGEFLSDLDEVQEKIMDLATSVPAEKYNWRPAAGVRSISEVYMHVAGGNYFLATFLGVKPPADMPKDLEKISDKQQVLAELRKSFDHLRTIVTKESDADLDKQVKLFGNPATHRRVFTTMMNHLHEHLGQSIAYARMNGVVPPWSR